MHVHSRVTEGKVGGLKQEWALLVTRPFLDLYRLLLVECQDQGVPLPCGLLVTTTKVVVTDSWHWVYSAQPGCEPVCVWVLGCH